MTKTNTQILEATLTNTNNISFSVDENNQTIYECVALPLNVASSAMADGNKYMFTAQPQNANDLINIVDEHNDNTVVGRLVEPLTFSEEKGLIARFRLFDTTAANDIKTLIREDVKTGLSVKAFLYESNKGGDNTVRVFNYQIDHIGIVRQPAFTSASNIKIIKASKYQENQSNTEKETNKMTTTTSSVEASASNNTNTITEVSFNQIVDKAAEVVLAKTRPVSPHKIANCSSFTDVATKVFTAHKDANELAKMFSVDENLNTIAKVGSDVIRPHWIDEILSYRDTRQPLINLFGRTALGDSHTESWVENVTDIDTLFTGEHEEGALLDVYTIKTESKSATVKSAGMRTYESYEMLRAATPQYRAEVLLTGIAGYDRFMEKEFETSLNAKATSKGVLTNHTDIKEVRAQLIDISAEINDVTGSPMSIMALSPQLYKEMSAMDGLYNPKYGTENIYGIGSAATLQFEIDGLHIVRSPFLTGKTMLASNSSTAKFSETGAMLVTKDDPDQLAKGNVIYGFYNPNKILQPKGLLKYTVE